MPDRKKKSNTPRVLLVEDEQGIARTITIQLGLMGFSVQHLTNGFDVLSSPWTKQCDVIILDWMLPDVEGPELIGSIKKITTVPILMLTARTEILDKLIGLDSGADDYLTKPFDMLELVARLKALLRRYNAINGKGNSSSGGITYGDLEYTPDTRQLTASGKEIKLTPTELRLLEILINEPGKVFSRDRLIEKVLGYQYEGYGRTLDAHIARLRSKIENNPKEPRYIITVYGIGYKFGIKQ